MSIHIKIRYKKTHVYKSIIHHNLSHTGNEQNLRHNKLCVLKIIGNLQKCYYIKMNTLGLIE